MSEFSRRSLLGGAVAAAATTMWSQPVRAQYVWQKPDWQAAEFDALTHSPAIRIKQVIHGFGINDGRVPEKREKLAQRPSLRHRRPRRPDPNCRLR